MHFQTETVVPAPECGRLLVVVADAGAPSETFIRRDLAALEGCGWQVRVQSLASGGVPWPRDPVLWRMLGERARAYLGSPRQMAALLRRGGRVAQAAALARDCDLVLAQFAWLPADAAAVAAAVADRPWVCAVHANDVFVQSPRMLRKRLAGARGIVACSRLAAEAVKAAGVTAPVAVVHHGLPLENFPFDAEPRKARSIVAVGRLEPKKGFDVLMEALPRIQTAFPEVSLRVAGWGSQAKSLLRQVRRLGLQGRVDMPGWLDEGTTRAWLAAASVCVLPSRRMSNGDRDGMANVLLEAMALGTPVITTPAGAAGESIRDGVNGLLVAPDDPDALAQAVGRLLADEDLCRRLVHAARATVESRFDRRQVARQLSQVLWQAAEGRVGA